MVKKFKLECSLSVTRSCLWLWDTNGFVKKCRILNFFPPFDLISKKRYAFWCQNHQRLLSNKFTRLLCYSTLLLNPWGNKPNYWVILGHPIHFEGTNETPLVKWLQLAMEGCCFQRCSDKRIWVCSFGDLQTFVPWSSVMSHISPVMNPALPGITLYFSPNYFYATIYALCLFFGLEIETVSQRLSCTSKYYFKSCQSWFFALNLVIFLQFLFFFPANFLFISY